MFYQNIYDKNINMLNDLLSMINNNKLKSNMGKKLIHFPLEKINEITNIIKQNDKYTLKSKDGTIEITKQDIICSRNEDVLLKRKSVYLLTEIKSGHNEQSIFLLNDDESIGIYLDKIKNKIVEIKNNLTHGKSVNHNYINEYIAIKDVTAKMNNSGRIMFKYAYAINIKPYDIGSFSFIKTKENGNINIKIANHHIIVLDNNNEISIFSSYDECFNEKYQKIDDAIDRFNKNKSINRQNIFTVIQNYKYSILETIYPVITLDGQIKDQIKIIEIDQQREKSLIDFPSIMAGYTIKLGNDVIASSESYHGSLKIPTIVNI